MSSGETPNTMTGSEAENHGGISFVDGFKQATSKLLQRFLKYFKFENFSGKCYPEIYKNDPQFLRDVFDQLLPQIKESIDHDIDSLCQDQHVYSKLEELNKLDKEASLSSNTKTWRPSGDPNEDIRDHRWKYKLAHKKNLESLLENMRSQNDKFFEQLMTENEEIMMLKEKIIKQDEQNEADLSTLKEVDFNMIENTEQLMDDDS